MKHYQPRNLFLSFCLGFAVFFSFSQFAAASPKVFTAARHDTSPALRNLVTGNSGMPSASREKHEPRPTRAPFSNAAADPVVQQLNGSLPGVTAAANFEGQGAQDTRDVFGFAFVPPDTNGAAGPNQYVQIVNVTIAVYDKKTGVAVLGPAAIH